VVIAKPADSVVVLGLDPSLRSTGYGVVRSYATMRNEVLAHGVIRTPAGQDHGSSLLLIQEKLEDIILTHRPDVAAIEKTIYVQSHSVAITLGVTRGAILVLLARHGIPVHDYPPRSVKSATTGSGAAGKSRVALLVRAQLGLHETPASDAADALAVALTHAQRQHSRRLILRAKAQVSGLSCRQQKSPM
jgi:crossover junction endodeoxyribonuclease RuvC